MVSCKKLAQRSLRAEKKLKIFVNRNATQISQAQRMGKRTKVIVKQNALARKANRAEFRANSVKCRS